MLAAHDRRGSRASCRRRRGRCRPPPAGAQQLERRARRVACAPTASSTRSAPSPSVASRTASSASSRVAEGRVRAERERALAPLRLGLEDASRAGCPTSSAACSVTSPIVPAPSTTARATGSPASPSRTAWTPLASGSISAPTRAETPSGSARASAAGRGHEVGERAGGWTPISARCGHRFSCPARHSRQCPQPAERVDRHARAVPLAGARARRDDDARELVAHDQRRRAVAHVAEVALDLRAADARPPRGAGSARPRRGRPARAAPRPSSVRPVPHDRLHAGSFMRGRAQ